MAVQSNVGWISIKKESLYFETNLLHSLLLKSTNTNYSTNTNTNVSLFYETKTLVIYFSFLMKKFHLAHIYINTRSFKVTLSPAEYLTVEHSTFTTFEKTKTTVNWDFSQTLKFFREFRSLPRFPRKMVLYWSTKLGIIKPWTNNWSLRRFDLGFLETSKQVYQKLQYREKFFGEFQGLPHFPRIMFLYL